MTRITKILELRLEQRVEALELCTRVQAMNSQEIMNELNWMNLHQKSMEIDNIHPAGELAAPSDATVLAAVSRYGPYWEDIKSTILKRVHRLQSVEQHTDVQHFIETLCCPTQDSVKKRKKLKKYLPT